MGSCADAHGLAGTLPTSGPCARRCPGAWVPFVLGGALLVAPLMIASEHLHARRWPAAFAYGALVALAIAHLSDAALRGCSDTAAGRPIERLDRTRDARVQAAFAVRDAGLPVAALMMAGGLITGIIVGATPGLAGPMAMAIALPILLGAFGYAESALLPVLGFLLGIMKGATLGGPSPRSCSTHRARPTPT